MCCSTIFVVSEENKDRTLDETAREIKSRKKDSQETLNLCDGTVLTSHLIVSIHQYMHHPKHSCVMLCYVQQCLKIIVERKIHKPADQVSLDDS